MRRTLVVGCAVTAAALRVAHADDPAQYAYSPAGIELDREDAPAGRTELSFDGGAPLDTWGVSVGLGMLQRPLVIATNPGTRVPVSRRETVTLGGAIAVGERIVLDAHLPVARQDGPRLASTGLDSDAPLARYVLRDLRIAARVRVAGDAGTAVFARGAVTLPTGDDDNFAGEPSQSVMVGLIGRATVGDGVVLAASGAARVRRAEVTLGDTTVGNELDYAGGVVMPLTFVGDGKTLAVLAEVDGAVGDRVGAMRGPSPLEVRGGFVGHAWGKVSIGVRFGVGLISEIGAPAWRGTVEVAWQGDWRLASLWPHAASSSPAGASGDDED